MRITSEHPKNWKDLEYKVCKLLNESGYASESQKKIETVRGPVEVDVFSTSDDELIKKFIVECKYWSTPIPKEKIHAFRTVVHDSGCMVGIVISKEGFQSGAYKAAYCSNVLLKDWSEFLEMIKNKWVINQLHMLKSISKPLSIYIDIFSVPLEKLTKEERIRYDEITLECIGAYAIINLSDEDIINKKSLIVGDFEFTDMDSFFEYCEKLFLDSIKKYKDLFKEFLIDH